jgi:perosamine synthetase
MTIVPPIRIDFSADDKAWIAEKITEVLASGRLTLGVYGDAFEQQFAAMHGVKHAIAVNSGTCSLEIIFRALGVAGKDVLVPADTFAATAVTVIAAGGHPVLMDTDLRTLSTTAAEIEKRLTANTAAVAIVHCAGLITDEMPAIVALCKARGVHLVEDAAHAHMSSLNGQYAGSFGIAGSFSFYPTKVMTSAEGGMITTDDDKIAAEARIYRDQGKASFHQNSHVRLGYNWRMSEPCAIIGLRHLQSLKSMVDGRRKAAALYNQALIGSNLGLRPIVEPKGNTANFYKYACYLPEGVDRAAFKRYMKDEQGVIFAGEAYEFALQQHPIFAHLDTGDLPDSLEACGRQVCLPMFGSMTEAEVSQVLAGLGAAKSAGLL